MMGLRRLCKEQKLEDLLTKTITLRPECLCYFYCLII